MTRSFFLALLLLAWCSPGLGRVEVMQFDDGQQEQRYNSLIRELRCLVCQNQNLADSNAELAADLRHKTYEMITAGASDEEVVQYMVDRYGDFVLYRPPVKASTVFLWAGPFLILLFGLFVVVRLIRQRRGQAGASLSPDQRERARRLLNGD